MKSIGIALKQANQYLKSGVSSENNVPARKDPGTMPCVTDSPEIELHLNIWKMKKSTISFKTRFFIDFGIKTKIKNDRIAIFVPYELEKDNAWEDLGNKICTDNNLLCAIFNEELSATAQKNKCYFLIRNSSKEEDSYGMDDFYFYLLGDTNVSIEESKDRNCTGCWIYINIEDHESLDPDKMYYVRFRIFLKKSEQFAIRRSLSNDLVQAAFSKLDLHDLRVNENRNLDKKVREKMIVDDYSLSYFSKIHIFYIANYKVSVENASIAKDDCRIIESNIWKNYEPSRTENAVYVAHHWKLKEMENNKRLEKLELFFTAKYPRIQFFTLIAYLFVIILLGAVGSWLSSDLKFDNKLFSNYKIYVAGLMLLYIITWTLRQLRVFTKFFFKES